MTDKNELMEQEQGLQEKKDKNYIQEIIEEGKRDFLAVNVGMDLDFVYFADWLKLTKLGKFVERNNEEVDFGSEIDVVFGKGEQRWVLWGKEDSPEEGELIVAENNKETAVEKLENWLEINPEASNRYSTDEIDLTYVAYLVPVENLKEGNELPQIYILPMPKSASFEFGNYTRKIYKGQYKDLGIPRRTGVAEVVTRISSKEMANNNYSWVGMAFTAIEKFNPDNYKA